jgi:hypothetical protein
MAQCLGFAPRQLPKPVDTRACIARARTRAAAAFVGAMLERTEQVALRAPSQIAALLCRQRAPLFDRPPARIVRFAQSFVPSFCVRVVAWSRQVPPDLAAALPLGSDSPSRPLTCSLAIATSPHPRGEEKKNPVSRLRARLMPIRDTRPSLRGATVTKQSSAKHQAGLLRWRSQ